MDKLITGTKRFFINENGFCYKQDGLKKIPITLQVIRGKPKVKIETRRLNMVNLMIEHFIGEITHDYRVSYKIIDNKVPLKHIRILKNNFTNEDDVKCFEYGCREKSYSANSRKSKKNIVESKIDKYDVLNSLKRSGFNCSYCTKGISPTNWHLDHITPISKGGTNTPDNLAASCPKCNLMKRDYTVDDFLSHIKRIIEKIDI